MKVKLIPKRKFIPEAELTVPHQKGEITFVAPYFGNARYGTVRSEIEKAGLRMPTFAETVSLAYDALVTDRDGKYARTIRDLMNSYWLRASNGILYVPNKGAYIQDSPEFKDEEYTMDENTLVEKLKAKDPSVRYVPFGYKLESHTSKELENNAFVIGLAGSEGATKLAEMSDKFKNQPYVWSFANVPQPMQDFARFGSCDSGERLSVVAYGFVE